MMGICTSGADGASCAPPLERGVDFDGGSETVVHGSCSAIHIWTHELFSKQQSSEGQESKITDCTLTPQLFKVAWRWPLVQLDVRPPMIGWTLANEPVA